MRSPNHQSVVAFGPEMRGWGSWEWIGADVQAELAKYYPTRSFSGTDIPECDVLFIVKHALPYDAIEQISRRTSIAYCPVDYYGSAADIDADAAMLRKCSRILIHCDGLR